MDILLASIFKGIGAEAIEHVRRANTADRLLAGSQLFVLQPDHWLFPLLCQYKRQRRQVQIVEMQRHKRNMALDKTKHKLLGKLLAGTTDKSVDASDLKDIVMKITSIFCVQLPQHEPFLIELALMHCVHAWSERAGSAVDVWGFEAFLLRELDGQLAKTWFQCQFFLDTHGLLALAPMFYKEQRIAHSPTLRDLIALSFAESSNDFWNSSLVLSKWLAKTENKAAFDEWMVWVAETFPTVDCGFPEARDTSATSLHFMSKYVMNATQLVPSKRACIAIGLSNPHFVTRDSNNLHGTMLDRKAATERDEHTKLGPCIYVGATE